ncbi:MAG: hypothetical protein LBJ03_01955 [Holosporales bacterium]|jgi:DNA-3-methyladenine glycosylase II|nr:hypothetical protein [Holosporales bacterium]
MAYFKYGQVEIDYLVRSDSVLGEFINQIGFIERTMELDPFRSLVVSIIGQQISSKAADTVFNRLLRAVESITPHNIMIAHNLNEIGIPKRKVEYIRGIASAFLSGSFAVNELDDLSDDEVIKRLVSLPGIGKWSAEMFMIFSLQRKNILSWGDFGIKKGISALYSENTFNPETFTLYKSKYSPYASIASFYLWEAAKDPRQSSSV